MGESVKLIPHSGRDYGLVLHGCATTTHAVRTAIHFRIDRLGANGEVLEHVVGLKISRLQWQPNEAACKRWSNEPIMLRQGARVVHDRKTWLA